MRKQEVADDDAQRGGRNGRCVSSSAEWLLSHATRRSMSSGTFKGCGCAAERVMTRSHDGGGAGARQQAGQFAVREASAPTHPWSGWYATRSIRGATSSR